MNIREFHKLETPQSFGHLGLELETEYRRPILDDVMRKIPVGWTATNDNSLRNHGIEYVTNGATRIEDKEKLLKSLFDFVKTYPYIEGSPRTSFHVHVNILDMPVLNMYTGLVAYWLLEDLLFEMCGPYRKGNLFCLPLKATTGVVSAVLEDVSRTRRFASFPQDSYKYGAVNLAALYRYGSLEFRGMDGSLDLERKSKWIDILYYIMNNAGRVFGTPKNMLDFIYETVFISKKSPVAFIDTLFGDNKDLLKYVKSLIKDEGVFNQNIMSACTLLLPISYKVPDWTKIYSLVKYKPLLKKTIRPREEGRPLFVDEPVDDLRERQNRDNARFLEQVERLRNMT